MPITWSTDLDGFVHIQGTDIIDVVETLSPTTLPKQADADFAKRRWGPTANEKGQKYGVNPVHILAVIISESQGWEKVISANGQAFGLMQINPAAAGVSYTETQLLNPVFNIDVGTRMLRQFWDRLYAPDLPSLASAYNGGIKMYKADGKLIDTHRPWPDPTGRWGMREERSKFGGYIDHVVWSNNYLLGLERRTQIVAAAEQP